MKKTFAIAVAICIMLVGFIGCQDQNKSIKIDPILQTPVSNLSYDVFGEFDDEYSVKLKWNYKCADAAEFMVTVASSGNEEKSVGAGQLRSFYAAEYASSERFKTGVTYTVKVYTVGGDIRESVSESIEIYKEKKNTTPTPPAVTPDTPSDSYDWSKFEGTYDGNYNDKDDDLGMINISSVLTIDSSGNWMATVLSTIVSTGKMETYYGKGDIIYKYEKFYLATRAESEDGMSWNYDYPFVDEFNVTFEGDRVNTIYSGDVIFTRKY